MHAPATLAQVLRPHLYHRLLASSMIFERYLSIVVIGRTPVLMVESEAESNTRIPEVSTVSRISRSMHERPLE